METTSRFILFQILIIVPFISGVILKKIYTFKDLQSFTKRLIRINLIFLEPAIALWSTWGLSLTREMIFLPLSGLVLVMTGMLLGKRCLKPLGLTGKRGAAFLISSSLANHGFTMGAFFCYLFLGEKGLGLAFLFLSYFMPFIFLVIFPYARKVSSGKKPGLASVKEFFLTLQNMPFFAILSALLLIFSGFRRPGIIFPTDILIITSMILYYFTLGLNFEMPTFFRSGRENLALCLIKFLIIPFLTFFILNIMNPDPSVATVIFIQSFMPVAIYSVVASVLFDLDPGFSSNLFVWNTIIFLTCILPVLFVFRNTIFSLPV
jgi:predicted permease